MRSRRVGAQIWKRVVVAVLGATLGMLAMAVGAVSATADPRSEAPAAEAVPPGIPGPLKIRNQATGLCLDVGPDTGTLDSYKVYMGYCNSSDRGQRWGWWNGGYLMSLARNQCLSDSGQFDTQLVSFCSDYGLEHWRHQNWAIVNAGSGHCLQPMTTSEGVWLRTVTCRTTPQQGWWVSYW